MTTERDATQPTMEQRRLDERTKESLGRETETSHSAGCANLGGRHGFTLIELFFVVMIIGLIANLAFPYLRHVRSGADASSVMSDVNTIRLAAFDHFVATGAFPNTAGLGAIPPQMADRLPEGFDFRYGDSVTYMWISITFGGQHMVGPLIFGDEKIVTKTARLASSRKIQTPTICWFMYDA